LHPHIIARGQVSIPVNDYLRVATVTVTAPTGALQEHGRTYSKQRSAKADAFNELSSSDGIGHWHPPYNLLFRHVRQSLKLGFKEDKSTR
jgi:hypothetical protein